MQVVDVNGNMFGYDYLEVIGINGKPKTIGGGGGSGTVTSVGLSMPSAFSVANSPVTTSGTIAVSGAGVASQYIRGDGSLANFPTSTGGGASVSYYLNGSISQGTIGGVPYKEINSVPIIGAGTDFTINADGYIAQFITDVGDPNKLLIPAGNWNFETYFSASSSGGSPQFYIELYKYNGTTFTLIASNSATPENITGGTSIDLYFTALAVPATTLLATDRLAVRFYVIHSGRTITMHTENSHLSQIITTFSTGLTALNGLTSQVQYLAVGTSGTDFNISSATDTHTFNLPTASATNRGALSSADWGVFNGKQNAITTGTTAQYLRGDLSLATFPTIPTVTPAALTKVDDTNVTLTLGGTPSTALLQATSLTLGWTGTLADSRIASAATWNAKQDALVSGTNIKTINATSLLGSGNISVQPTLTLTTTGTSGASTLVGSTLNIPQYSGGGSSNPSVIAISITDGTPITGATSTISTSLLVPANTISTNAILLINWAIQRVSGATGTVSNQIYINTSNTLTGATLVATGGNLATNQIYVNQSRDIQKVGIVAKTSTTNQQVNDGTISTSINTFTLNNSVPLYFIFACFGGAGDVSVIRQVRITQFI